MKRRIVANGVAERLFTAEDAIDQALARVAELAAALPSARMEANVSAVVGQRAFERSAEAMASLAAARRGIVELHAELAEVRDRVGLRGVAFGGSDKPEETKPKGLAVVDAGRAA